jgi:very-short-patch-repair endonuclease
MEGSEKKTELAKALRRKMTPAENRLWSRLKGRQFSGLKFLRQAPAGPYILDFYCPVARIAIEADGTFHSTKRDGPRDAYLLELGIRTIRFRNDAIMNNLDAVLDEVFRECQGCLTDFPIDG